MDISRVVSDVGSMIVKYPAKGDSSKNETAPVRASQEISIDKIDVPQKQIAKIVLSAEELLRQKNSTESSSGKQEVSQQTKGQKIDEYA